MAEGTDGVRFPLRIHHFYVAISNIISTCNINCTQNKKDSKLPFYGSIPDSVVPEIYFPPSRLRASLPPRGVMSTFLFKNFILFVKRH